MSTLPGTRAGTPRAPAWFAGVAGPAGPRGRGAAGSRQAGCWQAGPVDGDEQAHRWRALAVCLVALFMTLLDVSITNVALPAIGAATGSRPAQLQWIVSGYTLAFGLVPIIGGRLGDDLGRRRMFLVGVLGFVVTSALAALAPTAGLLVAARVAQGLAGGLINPQVSGLVQQMFLPAERGRAFGAIGGAVGVATAVGPVVGGALIALGGPHLGWRLVFLVNVPIGLVAAALARRWLPGHHTRGRRRRLDVPGALLLGGATLAVLLAAVEYDTVRDARLAWLLVPAGLLLAGFLRRERRLTRAQADPLFDLRLFRDRSYSAGVGLALLYFCGFTGLPLVLSLYYQQGLGYSALRAGLGVTAFAVGSAVAATVAGRLLGRVGRPLLIGALAVFAVGAVGVGLVVRSGPGAGAAAALAVPLLLLGLGAGGVITPNQALSLQRVDPAMGSTAGGVLQTAQRIGSAIGQAVIGAVFFASLPRAAGELTGPARDAAYGAAVADAVVVTLVFVLAALALAVLEVVAGRRAAATAAEPAARPVAGRSGQG
jgi:EmrB/QacA subfamily drug resistance transporter